MLVEIEDAELLKTRDLLARVLEQLNVDNRVKFYVSRGKGGPTVQCLRMMLSRVRGALSRKGRPRKHFTLHADIFPWTLLNGSRFDCVIISRSRNGNHSVLETLEGLAAHGTGSIELI